MDPPKENGKILFHSKEEAEALGRFFEEKMAATRNGQRIPASEIKEAIGRLTPKGRMKVTPAINAREIKLAVRDIPRHRAAGPDLLPAEMYIECPAMHRGLAALFNEMLECDYIPRKLRRFYIVPLDKAGKDPTACASKRPIALLSPMIKLLELVLVRRIMPYVEHRISGGQYAYQEARSTEILLADLNRFVTENV